MPSILIMKGPAQSSNLRPYKILRHHHQNHYGQSLFTYVKFKAFWGNPTFKLSFLTGRQAETPWIESNTCHK